MSENAGWSVEKVQNGSKLNLICELQNFFIVIYEAGKFII